MSSPFIESLEERRLLAALSFTKTLSFTDLRGGDPSAREYVEVRNVDTSGANLNFGAGDISIVGADAAFFRIINPPSSLSIAPGGRDYLTVVFDPPSGSPVGLEKDAQIELRSNSRLGTKHVNLRGLTIAGYGGFNEPSLHNILKAKDIAVNVGDTNPALTTLTSAPGSGDQILASKFRASGSGPVEIIPISAFGVQSETGVRVGYYSPGETATLSEMSFLYAADMQTTSPVPKGATRFIPNGEFSLYGLFPSFRNADGSVRVVYQEDSLNTWESNTAQRNKVRVYPYIDRNRGLQRDTYVVAFEEYTTEYDFQDVVVVVRNVTPVSNTPELSLFAPSAAFQVDEMTFGQIANKDTDPVNFVRDIQTLTVKNTGMSTLNVTGGTTSGPFTISGGFSSFSLAPGATRDLRIRFTATGGGFRTGTLTLASNDTSESSRVVQLKGFWQEFSENDTRGRSVEPTLAQVFSTLGLGTTVVSSGQSLGNNGKVEKVGEEILAPYWLAADSSAPVQALQLAAYHGQGDIATLNWHLQGSNTVTSLMTHRFEDGQTLYPRKERGGEALTQATFSPNLSPFGFRVDSSIWSDPTKNVQEVTNGGHYLRAWPARDQNGNLLTNTYVLVNDYHNTGTLVNYDYNDNVYLVSNIRPAGEPIVPPGGQAFYYEAGKGFIDWGDVTGVAGYNIYRSSTAKGTYAQLNSSPIERSYFYNDPPNDGTWYYRVTSITSTGKESQPNQVVLS